MRTIPLGNNKLTVSELAFGGIPIQRLGEEDAIRVVRRCLDLGVTFIDTANAYSTSEERIGKAIAGRRSSVTLATKSGARDVSTLRAHLELSFKRLAVDYIDLVQLHNISTQEHMDAALCSGGLLEVVNEYKAAGRIRHIGVTSHHMDMACKLVETGLFETIMFPFSVATQEPIDRLIPLCRQRQVGFIAMKPMAGGMIEDANVAFKFLRQFPDIVPVVGIQAEAEIEQIVAVMNGPVQMSSAETLAAQALKRELGARFCRACDYCQPCQEGIHISDVLRLRSFARRMPIERVRGDWGRSAIASAENCAECGDCETRCPYHLPIREMLKENIAWYHREVG